MALLVRSVDSKCWYRFRALRSENTPGSSIWWMFSQISVASAARSSLVRLLARIAKADPYTKHNCWKREIFLKYPSSAKARSCRSNRAAWFARAAYFTIRSSAPARRPTSVHSACTGFSTLTSCINTLTRLKSANGGVAGSRYTYIIRTSSLKLKASTASCTEGSARSSASIRRASLRDTLSATM